MLRLPDDADHGQRQDHREVEDVLVDAAAADLPVEQDGEEDADRRGDEHEERQPQQVVAERRPEERVLGEQERVVLEADDVLAR